MNKNAMMKTENVKISQLVENKDNPRYITKPAFEKLVKSILIFPRMLKIRPIVVDGNYKVLGGNMRLKALERIEEMQATEIRASLESLQTYKRKTELERANLLQYWKEWQANPVASVICLEQMTEEEQREFVIKDNVGFGEWNFDVLANEWDDVQLTEWGMNLPQPEDTEEKEEAKQEEKKPDYIVEIRCQSEEDYKHTFQILTEAGYDCLPKD